MRCPKCGSSNTARIMYGMPAFSGKLRKELDEGKVRLGGCEISPRNPNYHCNKCGYEFIDEDDLPEDGEEDDPEIDPDQMMI